MKTDLYTKIVLSVIALCLVIIVIRNTSLVTHAHASQTTEFALESLKPNADGSINVKITGVNVTFEKLPVEIKNSSVPVEVKNDISLKSSYGVLPVSVKGTVPVEVKNSYINVRN